MTYKQFVFNPIQVNTWVIHNDHGDCAIFDPGCHDRHEENILIEYLDDNKLRPTAVIATHGHFDHIPGVSFLKAKFGCPFKAHQSDKVLLDNAVDQGRLFGFNFIASDLTVDDFIEGGSILKIGELEFNALHVPGHSPGSLAFYNESAKLVIVGDVLFKASIGRTDLPGGDYDTLMNSINNNLMTLPDETLVLPGHGPVSTIGDEKQHNPFLNEKR